MEVFKHVKLCTCKTIANKDKAKSANVSPPRIARRPRLMSKRASSKHGQSQVIMILINSINF